MEILSYGFFTSTYNLHTPFIYKSLGLHEPVYGNLPRGNPSRFIKRLETSERVFNQVFGKNEKSNKSEDFNGITEALGGLEITKAFNDAIKIQSPIPLTKEVFSQSRVLDNVFDVLNQGKELQPV